MSSKSLRRKNGQFSANWEKKVSLALMVASIAISIPNYVQGSPKNSLINPQAGVVQVAQAKSLEDTAAPVVIPLTIEEQIRAKDWVNDDVAVFYATCESGQNPNAHGDKTLMVFDPKHNEMVGDSHGLYQIRTGGKERSNGKIWNRARANGMSVNEFINWLRVPENNIEYAFKMSKGGKNWNAWHNCTRKLGGN